MTERLYISGLGLTAAHYRKIADGSQYNHLFPATTGTDPIISQGSSVYGTLDLMADIIRKTKSDTVKISKELKGKNLVESCRNVFDFAYKHIQYKQDKEGVEQLRRPSRSWKDRKSGIDCDCFAIFCGSILNNLGINFALRICEINGKGYFQHVYVVVPTNQSSSTISGPYITIDPVLDTFNTEAPGVTKTHDKMIPVQYLNGIENPAASPEILGLEFAGFSGLGCNCGNDAQSVANKFHQSCVNHLQNTRQAIAKSSSCLQGLYDAPALLGAIDFALLGAADLDTFIRNTSHLAGLEESFMTAELSAIEDIAFGPEYALGKIKLGGKKPAFFTKVAAAAKTVKEVAAKAVDKGKQGAASVKEVAKKAGKAIVKTNPLAVAARTGFLLAMEINMFGIANQLRWGYATPDQLKKYGVSQSDANRAKEALAKVTKLFVDTLQGQADNLKKAILSGKQAINGLSGALGEPVTVATTTSAAMTFILKAKDWIKGLNIVPKVQSFIENNPDAAKKIGNKIADKVFSQRKETNVDSGGNLVETEPTTLPTAPTPEPTPVPTPEPFYQESSAPVQTEESAPIMEQSAQLPAENTQTKSGGSKGLLIGLGLLAVVAIAASTSSSSKPEKSLNGVKKAPKKKAKKSKRTLKIK